MTYSFGCVPNCKWTRYSNLSKAGPFMSRETFNVGPSLLRLKTYTDLNPMHAQRMTAKPLFAIQNLQSDAGMGGFRAQDAVIIVDHGSRREESNSMLHAFVDMYKEKTGHPIVEAAHMELARPTIKDAFRLCVQKGASRVIVSPYFLFPGRHWKQDIPSLAAEAAKEHPGISYVVTAPLGLHELMVNVLEDRIKYCLSHVAGDVAECEMCLGTGQCKQQAA